MKITLFTQPGCVKCPSVKQALEEVKTEKHVEYSEYNVRTDDGLFEATKYNLMTTPALIVGNDQREIKIIGDIDKKRIISTLEELGA